MEKIKDKAKDFFGYIIIAFTCALYVASLSAKSNCCAVSAFLRVTNSSCCWVLFGLILGGGVIYSLGVIPFTMKKNVAHFIWHFFVLGGAVVQWIGIYLVIYLG